MCIPKPLAMYHEETPHSAMEAPLGQSDSTPRVWLSYDEWPASDRILAKKLSSTNRSMADPMLRPAIYRIDLSRQEGVRPWATELNSFGMNTHRRIVFSALLHLPGRSGVIVRTPLSTLRVHLQMGLGIDRRLPACSTL